jgi:hypothetical protein
MTQPYGLPPQAAQQAPPNQATPRKPKKSKKWPWIVGITFAFVMGMVVGGNNSGSTSTTAASPTSTSAVPATPAAAAPSTQAPAAPAGPKTQFGDGTYLVGTDIAEGSYKSTGPRPSAVPICYWARMKDDSGSVTSILANNTSQGATRLTVKKGEYLEVTGCDFTKG